MTPPPPRTLGNARFTAQRPADFVKKTVPFLRVMSTTRGNHVRPFVATAATTRNDVINRVTRGVAVRTAVVVTQEYGSSRERRRTHPRR